MKQYILLVIFFSSINVHGQAKSSFWLPKQYLDTSFKWTEVVYPMDVTCPIQSIKLSKNGKNIFASIKTVATEEFVNYRQSVKKVGDAMIVAFKEKIITSTNSRWADSFSQKANYCLHINRDKIEVVGVFNNETRRTVFLNNYWGLIFSNLIFDIPKLFIAKRYSFNNKENFHITPSGFITNKEIPIRKIEIIGILNNPNSGSGYSYKIRLLKNDSEIIDCLLVFESKKLKIINDTLVLYIFSVIS